MFKIIVDKYSVDQFHRVLRRYAKHRKFDNADALNRAGMQLAYSAAYNTRKADPAEISATLKRQIQPKKITRTGKESKDQTGVFEATTVGLVHMMIRMRQGRLFYKGFPNATNPRQFSREELKKMALRYVNRRISSAAFIASGWKPAYNVFRMAYKGRSAGTDAKKFRKYPGIGGATAAVLGDKPAAVLWNRSTTKDPSSGPALMRYGREGLNKGMQWVRQDMLKYLTGQLRKRTAEANAGR
jgi:hypothetical protein